MAITVITAETAAIAPKALDVVNASLRLR